MKLESVDDHLIYLEPRRYIEKKVLPLLCRCPHCNAVYQIDMISDIRAHNAGRSWRLAVDCMVCNQSNLLSDYRSGSDEQSKNYNKHYNQIVSYYASLYPWYYTWIHNDSDDGKAVVMSFCLGVVSVLGLGLLFAPSMIAVILGLILFMVFPTHMWYTISPQKKQVFKKSVKKRLSLSSDPYALPRGYDKIEG